MLLSGCAVGPDFKAPGPPAASRYLPGETPAATVSTPGVGGAAQQLTVGGDVPGQWWSLFGSGQLDALIREAVRRYPDIAAQQAALRAARENVRAGEGVLWPQVQGAANGEREKVSGASIAPGFPGFITNIFQAGINVSYTFDLFGGERRTIEGLRAQVDEQTFRLEASYLTLTTNLAATAIQVASLRDQVAVTQEVLGLEEKILATIERQYRIGSQPRAAVLQQQTIVAATRATLPGLQLQLAVAQHQLAMLTGRYPADVKDLAISLADLTLPQQLPVSLPSSLVAQRPDVQAQAALLHQANAAVGVATANRLPQLTLTGSFGDESLSFGPLLQPGSNTWNVAAGLTQPLFAGGTLRAKQRAAVAVRDQAEAQYDLVVLQAFKNVADTLTALDTDARALHAQTDALEAARESLDLVQRQYAVGAANIVSLLTAQQAYQQARLACVSAATARFEDTVTLFQALGGGWWNRQDTAPASGGS